MICASGQVEIRIGDSRELLRAMPDQSVNCIVTSPPYFGLRDYGCDGQIGLEQTPDAFVSELVGLFREARRVLRDDGTLWLNLGDTITAKQLQGIPWRVAFALQADGWYLRQDIIWAKPNPMPESVRDRCTKAHEYIFLLSKSARYFYDAGAVKETSIHAGRVVEYDGTQKNSAAAKDPKMRTRLATTVQVADTRNKRSVWTVSTQPYSEAHFATYPPALIEPCILAGCPKGGTVLDPFGGAGTTGLVAARHHRRAILCELNPEYAAMAHKRISREWREQVVEEVEPIGGLFG